MSQESSRFEGLDENLISSFMKEICGGELRVLDASLECSHRQDDTYNYVYNVRVELRQAEELEVAFLWRDGNQQTAKFKPDTQLAEILRHFLAIGRVLQARMALLIDGDRTNSIPFATQMVQKTLKQIMPPGAQQLTIVADCPQPIR